MVVDEYIKHQKAGDKQARPEQYLPFDVSFRIGTPPLIYFGRTLPPCREKGKPCRTCAVTVFWSYWSNAWLALLAYHVQVVLWNPTALRKFRPTSIHRGLLIAFQCWWVHRLRGRLSLVIMVGSAFPCFHISLPTPELLLPYGSKFNSNYFVECC